MAHSQPAKPKTITDGDTVHGVVAEFSDVDSLLAACERVRDAGYTKADAFTPFPVHGIDKALGIKPTVLPWITLAGGLTGLVTALLMQISMNSDWIENFSYPYIISGKPYLSLPAFIPVTFELSILFAAAGTFFGMWALNGLPKFSNPLFTSPRFDRATDDTFFLYLDAKDSRFDEAGAKALLGDLGGEYIEPVREDDSPRKIPRFLLVALAVLIGLSLIPALLVARVRVTKSSSPRFHVFLDMDFSPAKAMQQTSTLFADGRAMRPNVPGTVNRGQLDWDIDFQSGIDMEALARIDAPRAQRLVAAMLSGEEADGEAGEEPQPETPETEEPTAEEPQDEVKSEEPKAEEKADQPKAEEPAEMKAESEPAAEEPAADEPAADEPAADEPAAEEQKPAAEEPAMEESAQPAEEKPAEDKPAAEKPAEEKPTAEQPAEAMAADEQPAADESPAGLSPATGSTEDTTPWLTENPLDIDAAVLERGQQQFNIYCSVCHGTNGRGNGLVNQRAQRILATTWTPPSNIHDATLHQDAYPDGKLFSTITNGVRKMAGYGSQIQTRDRWAVVAYVRALQASQNATLEDVPASQRAALEKEQAKVKAELEAAAAAQAEAATAEAAK